MEPEIGAVTGLAWTATGGDLMTIEALRMPGSGKLTVTGQLGDVMRESVDAAYSFVRSRAVPLGIADAEFRETDLHLHFPAGSIPKDGPSAGIAVTLALASALSRRPVRRDLALTGEVTLRGKVLEIGGVKEKVLAAYRAGLREVILPKGNEKDVRDVPQEVRDTMAFTFASTMDEVFHLALLPLPDAVHADVAPVEAACLDDAADGRRGSLTGTHERGTDVIRGSHTTTTRCTRCRETCGVRCKPSAPRSHASQRPCEFPIGNDQRSGRALCVRTRIDVSG